MPSLRAPSPGCHPANARLRYRGQVCFLGEIIGPGGLGANGKVVELPDFGAAEHGPATHRVGREWIIPRCSRRGYSRPYRLQNELIRMFE